MLVESGGNESGGFVALMSRFTRLYSQLMDLLLILLQELQSQQRSLGAKAGSAGASRELGISSGIQTPS